MLLEGGHCLYNRNFYVCFCHCIFMHVGDRGRVCQKTNFQLLIWTITFYCIVLYCIVLYCIVLYCIVLYCIVLYCIVWLRIKNRYQIKTDREIQLAHSLFQRFLGIRSWPSNPSGMNGQSSVEVIIVQFESPRLTVWKSKCYLFAKWENASKRIQHAHTRPWLKCTDPRFVVFSSKITNSLLNCHLSKAYLLKICTLFYPVLIKSVHILSFGIFRSPPSPPPSSKSWQSPVLDVRITYIMHDIVDVANNQSLN